MASLKKVAVQAKKHLLSDNKDAKKESKEHSAISKNIDKAVKATKCLPKKLGRGKK